YEPGKRSMLKVKHERTADVVVGGFRWRAEGSSVASLLLGLFDDAGVLHHVGVTSSFKDSERAALVEVLAPLRAGAAEGHPWIGSHTAGQRQPGGPSRWNAGRDLSWQPLRPAAVAEVAYDHLQGDRFRHATTFQRWRPDRRPESCTYAQLEVVVPEELSAVFGA
ncbi:MAG: ATP dependent DNA ligase, partial [Acidimicrobiales bacterium]